MKQCLDLFLQKIGFEVMPSNLAEFTIYYQFENSFVNVVYVIEDRQGLYLTSEQLDHMKETIRALFQEKGYDNAHILSLVISSRIDQIKAIAESDSFCWFLQPEQKELIIYENQTADFYGLKAKLEDWLLRQKQDGKEPMIEKHNKRFYVDWKNKAGVTWVITFLNVIVFLICTFSGELLYNIGELNVIAVMKDGEYYRILTSMFLHADIDHLFGNMLIFFFLGEIVEKKMGHVKYLLLYSLAGIGGGLLSMWYSLSMRNFGSSIGASGAIFGVIGALLWLVIVHKGRVEHITLGKILFLILYSLYSGFTATNIDNAAHIGGLAAGFLSALFLYGRKNKSRKRRRIKNAQVRSREDED